jgi:thioesterase domain-containing protein
MGSSQTALDEVRVGDLVALVNRDIPLAAYMQLQLAAAGPDGIRMRIPLAPNRNHMQTAFAGALQAATSLTGWTMTAALLLDQAPGDIVAQNSSIRFIAPVRSDFETHVAMPGGRTAERFVSQYERRGRARLRLEVAVVVHGERLAVADVRYAAVRHAGAMPPPGNAAGD